MKLEEFNKLYSLLCALEKFLEEHEGEILDGGKTKKS